jgi:hypothetical protein
MIGVQRFPLIVSAALKLRPKQFVIDGEVVVLNKPSRGEQPDDFGRYQTGPVLRARRPRSFVRGLKYARLGRAAHIAEWRTHYVLGVFRWSFMKLR